MRSLTKSNKHFERAVGKMPLGVSSNFRYWGDDKTIYIDHGKGEILIHKSVKTRWDNDSKYRPKNLVEYLDARDGSWPKLV